ncbi:acyltransferase [Kribbella alba]|uniref:Acyltransferase n=1 Tax=Kribbella alba TaxID=190197 RepID=A0ABN2F4W1_9ACTN
MSKRGGRVPEIDLVRVVTFGAVVAVHAVSASFAARDLGGNAALMLLHYTRSGFFVFMAIVLVRSAERSGRTGKLRRRLMLVGVPYLTWSVIYLVVSWATGGRNAPWDGAWLALLTGTAWYHLYFLLVTMQFYVALPAFLWLLRRTRQHPWALIGASLAVAIVVTGWLRYGHWSPGLLGTYRQYAGQLLPTYQLLFVVGGVAALHLDTVLDWLTKHRRAMLAGTLAAALAMEVLYFVSVAVGTQPDAVSDPIQPVMQIWAVVLVAGLGAAATRWIDNGTPHVRWVDRASDLSFGVYLLHPLLLLGLLDLSWVTAPPAAVTAVLATALALAGSLLVTEVVRRSPASLPLTGRPRRRPQKSSVGSVTQQPESALSRKA